MPTEYNPDELAKEIADSYSPSRKHLLSLYRRNTVYQIVKEKCPVLTEDQWNDITNKLWDILHP